MTAGTFISDRGTVSPPRGIPGVSQVIALPSAVTGSANLPSARTAASEPGFPDARRARSSTTGGVLAVEERRLDPEERGAERRVTRPGDPARGRDRTPATRVSRRSQSSLLNHRKPYWRSRSVGSDRSGAPGVSRRSQSSLLNHQDSARSSTTETALAPQPPRRLAVEERRLDPEERGAERRVTRPGDPARGPDRSGPRVSRRSQLAPQPPGQRGLSGWLSR
jgi:hypothetical protein